MYDDLGQITSQRCEPRLLDTFIASIRFLAARDLRVNSFQFDREAQKGELGASFSI
jgi:hypothetical protein